MSDAFDPYYIWLGIPPEEQPANHYRLLGLTLFEENSEVIEAAANRQMAYLQELTAGDAHIDEAQKILGELARARVCLLSSEKKEAYDKTMRASRDSLNRGPETQYPKSAASSAPLMPPQIRKPTPNRSATGTDSPTAEPPQRSGTPADSRTKTKKRKSVLWVALPTVVILATIIYFSLQFLDNQAAKKEEARKAEIAKLDAERRAQAAEKEAAEATSRLKEKEQKEAEEAKKKAEAERKEKEKESQEKEEQARRAKEEAARKAKEEAAREEKEELDRRAKEEAARKAKEEQEEKARVAAKEAAREAQELRDNPEKLLQTKGFHQKDKKWIFSAQAALNQYSKELSRDWKAWKKTPVTTDSEIQAKLQKYNQLLLKTIEVGAMRQAVSEELTQALKDPAVAFALSSLRVRTSELARDAKTLQRPDTKLYKAVPKEPVIGSFAALIINEKESIIMQADKKLMGTHDAPQLFILPRTACDTIGFVPTQNSVVQKKVNDAYTMNLATVTIPRIRFGFRVINNGTFQTPLRHTEGVPHTDITAYGGKVGLQAWQLFLSRLQKTKVSHSPTAINQAKQHLNKLRDSLEKTETDRLN